MWIDEKMSQEDLKVPPVRRVITGHGQGKKAKIIRDDIATNVSTRPNAASTTIWCTDAVPVRQQVDDGGEDMGARRINSGTPANGTRLMIMDLFPGSQGAMHRTDTLDYVVAIEGEVEMLLDDSSVVLRAGDVLVQQGTIHAWTNRTNTHARLAIVLVDAQPLGGGFPPARAHGHHQSHH
jgi:quercetin dioxygenase-like cupin family protein